jgi:hypothetical protein
MKKLIDFGGSLRGYRLWVEIDSRADVDERVAVRLVRNDWEYMMKKAWHLTQQAKEDKSE